MRIEDHKHIARKFRQKEVEQKILKKRQSRGSQAKLLKKGMRLTVTLKKLQNGDDPGLLHVR